jgi:hypothetical protein
MAITSHPCQVAGKLHPQPYCLAGNQYRGCFDLARGFMASQCRDGGQLRIVAQQAARSSAPADSLSFSEAPNGKFAIAGDFAAMHREVTTPGRNRAQTFAGSSLHGGSPELCRWKGKSARLSHQSRGRLTSHDRIRRSRKLIQNVGAVLLVGSAIGESYCSKAVSFVEATGTRVCLESVEANGRLQDTQRMGKQR